MKLNRLVLLSLLTSILALNAFPQSKLQGAGKVSKVGASTTTKPPTKSKPSQRSSSSARASSTSGGVANSKAFMKILDISFANTDANSKIIDNYGNKLYAKDVKYLTPRICYKGLSNVEKQITLDIKIIDEDGKLETGSRSPEGYTYNASVKVEHGTENYIYLPGYGRSLGGSYAAGLYRVEFWYGGKLLDKKEIRLYSGATPVVPNNIFNISNTSFANVNKEGNLINNYGQTLYEGKVKYLKPKILYTGKYSNNQEITLYIRIFNGSGDLVSGSSSPIGFTYKNNVIIKPGDNYMILDGYGNENATAYKEGTGKFEVWMDGEKIHETEFDIKAASACGDDDLITSSEVKNLFPIWGITLGQTTWQEGANLGYNVKVWKDGPDRYMDVGRVTFWDHDGSGRFTSIYWTNYDGDFPTSWKSKGFSWKNSYDAWMEVFRSLGYYIDVKKKPSTAKYSGRNTLSASFVASSPDGMLSFDMNFNYGEDGYYTSSPNTLYSITVNYKERK